MKKVVLSILCAATAVLAGDISQFKISVNTTGINDAFKDWMTFEHKWLQTTKQERTHLRRAFADAFANAEARLILDFGKTVVPVVKAAADNLAYINVNDACNRDCAVKCFTPH